MAHEVASAGAQAPDPARWGLVVSLASVGRQGRWQDPYSGGAGWVVGMDPARYPLACSGSYEQ